MITSYLIKLEEAGPIGYFEVLSVPRKVVVRWSLDIHVRRLEGQVEEEGVGVVVLVDDLDGLPGAKVGIELAVPLVTLLKAVVEVMGLAAARLAHPVGAVVPQLPAIR